MKLIILSQIQSDTQKKDVENLNMDQIPIFLNFQKLENPYTYGTMTSEKNEKISTRYLKRLSKKVGNNNPMDLSLEDCKKERDLASRQYKR